MPDDGCLLKPVEVAQMWNVSPRTVHRYIADGKLPAVKLRGDYRIHRDDVNAVLQTVPRLNREPMTAAALSVRLAAGSRRSMRAADQVLVRAGEYLDRLGISAVAGDAAVVVAISTYQVGQQFGIRGIGFGPRDMVAM